MTSRVSGKNLDIGEALRSSPDGRRAGKALQRRRLRPCDRPRDGGGFPPKCMLHLTSGITLDASGAAGHAYASFDQAADRIENRLRGYRQRLKGKSGARASGMEVP